MRRLVRGPEQPRGTLRAFLNLVEGLDRIGAGYRINDFRHIAANADELRLRVRQAACPRAHPVPHADPVRDVDLQPPERPSRSAARAAHPPRAGAERVGPADVRGGLAGNRECLAGRHRHRAMGARSRRRQGRRRSRLRQDLLGTRALRAGAHRAVEARIGATRPARRNPALRQLRGDRSARFQPAGAGHGLSQPARDAGHRRPAIDGGRRAAVCLG